MSNKIVMNNNKADEILSSNLMMNNEINEEYFISSFNTMQTNNNNKNGLLTLKKYIFLTYEHTNNISKNIINEDWGINNKRLYSYLDYTFRSRYINDKIKIYTFKNNGNIIGIFYPQLYRNNIYKKPLYLIFNYVGKNKDNNSNKPVFSFPSNANDINSYLMTSNEITKKYGIKKCDIPQSSTNYLKNYNYFNTNKYVCSFDWDGIFKKILNHRTGGNSRDLILNEFKKNGIELNPNRMRQMLTMPFHIAVQNALYKHGSTYSYIVPALLFTAKHYDVVSQMLLEVEYPMYSGRLTKFVVVMNNINTNTNEYGFVKLLNVNMGYKNARLIGKVPENWTIIDDGTVTRKKSKKSKKSRTNHNNNNNNNNISINTSNNNSNVHNNHSNSNSNTNSVHNSISSSNSTTNSITTASMSSISNISININGLNAGYVNNTNNINNNNNFNNLSPYSQISVPSNSSNLSPYSQISTTPSNHYNYCFSPNSGFHHSPNNLYNNHSNFGYMQYHNNNNNNVMSNNIMNNNNMNNNFMNQIHLSPFLCSSSNSSLSPSI